MSNGLRTIRRRVPLVGLVLVTVMVTGLVTACEGGSSAVGAGALLVTRASCVGQDWSIGKGGRLDVVVRNAGKSPMRVTLTDAAASVYADVLALAPGASRSVEVALPNGTYRWECASLVEGEQGTTLRSSDRSVTGAGDVARSRLSWVTPQEQQQITAAYSLSVGQQLPRLQRAVVDLDAAIARGDLGGARSRWPVAHGQYELLGGAYTVFADFDASINGLADGLPGGVADPAFTGFHRLEYLLWNGGSLTDLRAASRRLVSDVTTLVARGRYLSVPFSEITRQAHEMLEQVLLVQLSGRGDYGSRCALVDLLTNIAGTRSLVARLQPLLKVRDPQLATDVVTSVDTLSGQVRQLQHADGSWPALTDLPRPQRASLNAAVGASVELLALIPTTVRIKTVGNPD
jgi:high-affinity iron transporter